MQKTWLLMVGISLYAERKLCLDYAAASVTGLEKVLLNRDGCAIPPEQITTLRDHEATAPSVVAALASLAEVAAESDTIILYFSGHGERIDDRFYLLTHETVSTRIAETALGMTDFQLALSRTRASGILVILDCCKSAGFAENADSFFRSLSNSDFRLLLSASRVGQASYEFPSIKNTFFTAALTEVLSGSIVGSELGVIYFQDMFRFIQMRVAENLLKANLDPRLQEPVYAGTSTKDPRLFILRNQSIERVESSTPRFSRAFVRQRIRRLSIAIGSTVAVMLVGYYIYLDHSRYIWHETSVVGGDNVDLLAIYAGDPKLNWLGFPHRILVTDINTNALPREIRPGVGNPIVSTMDVSIEPKLFDRLSIEWKSAVSIWGDGDKTKFFKYLSADPNVDDDDLPGLGEAYGALATVAEKPEEAKLKDLLFDETPKNSSLLLERIATLDPDAAIDILHSKDDDYSDAHFQRAVLEGLPALCTSAIKHELEANAKGDDDGVWYGALYRTGCALPTSAYAESLGRDPGARGTQLHWLGGLLQHVPSDFSPWLIGAIDDLTAEIVASKDEDPDFGSMKLYEDGGILAVELRTAEYLCPSEIPPGVMQLVNVRSLRPRVFAIEALAAQSASNLPIIAARIGDEPWALGTLVRAGWFDAPRLRAAMLKAVDKATVRRNSTKDLQVLKAAESQSDATAYFLRALRLRHVVDGLPIARAIYDKATGPELRIEAFRTIDALSKPQAIRDTSFPSAATPGTSTDLDPGIRLSDLRTGLFLDDSRGWFIRHDRRAFQDFMASLGGEEDDVAQVLGRVPLPDTVLQTLRDALGDQNKRLAAVIALAMRGNADDLESLLSSPDANVRGQAEGYAVYNDHLSEVVDRPSLHLFGTEVWFDLKAQLALRRSFEERRRHMPRQAQDVILAIFQVEYRGGSQGYRLLVQDAIDEVDGGSSYVGQDIQFNQMR